MVTERIPAQRRRGGYEGSGLVTVHSRGWTKRFNDENDISVYHGNAQNRKTVKKKKDENQRMVEEQVSLVMMRRRSWRGFVCCCGMFPCWGGGA